MNRILFGVNKTKNQCYLSSQIQKELCVRESITIEGSSNLGDLQRGISNFQGVNWNEQGNISWQKHIAGKAAHRMLVGKQIKWKRDKGSPFFFNTHPKT